MDTTRTVYSSLDCHSKGHTDMTLDDYYNDLPIGIENRITRRELCIRWQMPDRAVRDMIARLCQLDNGDDYIIYSSSNSGAGGYFRTDKAHLRRSFLRENSQRAVAVFRRGAKARRIERDKLPHSVKTNMLSYYRERLNMTQGDVAKIIAIDRMTAPVLSRYEKGQSMPTPAQLTELCTLYGCAPEDIYRPNEFEAYEDYFIKST
jgi:Predicted transcriptional regulators